VNRSIALVLIEWITSLAAQGVDLRDIGVLAKTKDLVDRTAERLVRSGIGAYVLMPRKADDRTKSGVRIATMHRAKGLEFDSVAIVGLNEGVVPFKRELDEASDKAEVRKVVERERALLHVAATRARRRLRVSWNGRKASILPGTSEGGRAPIEPPK
jgi:superfamily I DNA/RNA helicase